MYCTSANDRQFSRRAAGISVLTLADFAWTYIVVMAEGGVQQTSTRSHSHEFGTEADLATLGIDEVTIELNNSSFDAFITELAPDIVLFDRFMMEEQFGWRVEKHCPSALRVLETSDLQSLRDARQQQLKARLKHSPEQDDFSVSDTLFEGYQPALKTGGPGRLRQLCLECSG